MSEFLIRIHVSELYNSLLSRHAPSNFIPISMRQFFISGRLTTARISFIIPLASLILLSNVYSVKLGKSSVSEPYLFPNIMTVIDNIIIKKGINLVMYRIVVSDYSAEYE